LRFRRSKRATPCRTSRSKMNNPRSIHCGVFPRSSKDRCSAKRQSASCKGGRRIAPPSSGNRYVVTLNDIAFGRLTGVVCFHHNIPRCQTSCRVT
jgi:hypothetical protein